MDKNKAADKRLQNKYGISLAEYDAMLAAQGGVCAICGSPPKSRRLHVDHDHKFRYYRIETFVTPGGSWSAWMVEIPIVCYGRTRNEAVRAVRAIAKRKSVRGLLCFPCNGGLRKYSDNAKRLLSAAEYLVRFNLKAKQEERMAA